MYFGASRRRSVAGFVWERYLWLRRGKKTFTDPARIAALLAERAVENEKPYRSAALNRMAAEVVESMVGGMQVITLTPRSSTAAKVLYVHGGGYVAQPSAAQWRFLDRLAVASGATITVPIYPKAPIHQVDEALDAVCALYQSVDPGDGSTVLIGDSAGGGLALAVAQTVAPRSGAVVLFSPWLDIAMQNTGIPALEKVDPVLGAKGLASIGATWAGDVEPTDPSVSPIDGSLEGIGPLSVFVGTHELFLPDVRELHRRAEAEAIEIDVFEYAGMNHGFQVYPIPEARRVLAKTVEIMAEG